MTVGHTVEQLRTSRLLRGAARLGLVSRASSTCCWPTSPAPSPPAQPPRGSQVNANGALRAVAATPLGLVALAGAAVGFAAFGVIRLVGAYSDGSTGRFRRLTTAGQAFFYLVMAATTAQFLLGRRATGSAEQQHATTVSLLHHPLGRAALVAVGVGTVVVCGWQTWIALHGGFADSMETRDASRATRRAITWVGTVGILARAAVVAPHRRPHGPRRREDAAGRGPGHEPDDGSGLNRSAVGHALVWVIAAGFLVFAAYSLLESRYRTVHAGD